MLSVQTVLCKKGQTDFYFLYQSFRRKHRLTLVAIDTESPSD